jgi:hypothetical protein
VNGQIQYGSARGLISRATRTLRRQSRRADPRRFGMPPHASRPLTLTVVGAALLVMLLAAAPRELPGVASTIMLAGAWLALALAMLLPGSSERAGAELAHRLGDFRNAVNGVGDHPGRTDLEGLLTLARELELQDDEVADEMSQIRALLAAVALREELERTGLPTVPGIEAVPSGDECHFVSPVRFGRRRSDQFGHLVLSSGWLKFRGPVHISVTWSEVGTVERAAHDVIVHLRDSRRILRFSCPTIADAVRAGVLAEHLAQAAPHDDPDNTSSRYHAAL